MKKFQLTFEMKKLAFQFDRQLELKAKIDSMVNYLTENGRRYYLETIVLKEISGQIQSMQDLKISSFAALVLEPQMYTGEFIEDKVEKRYLCGPASIVNNALSFSGLRTRILFDENEERYVLVATL